MKTVPVHPCPSCGAALDLEEALVTPHVRCRYCKTESELPAALLERVREYHEEIRTLWAEEVEARWRGARETRWERASRRIWIPFAFMPLAGLSSCGFLLGGSYASTAFNVGALLLWTLTFGGLFLAAIRFPPTVAQALSYKSALGECMSCGGPVSFPEGDHAVQCGYCGASTEVNAEIEGKMLNAASSRLGGVRSERARLAAAYTRFDVAMQRVGPWMLTFVILASYAVLIGAVYLVGDLGAGDGGDETRPGWPPLLWWAITLLIGGGGVFFVTRIRPRLERRAAREVEAVTGRPLKIE